MATNHRSVLANIKRFDQLIAYLRDEMGWPIARDSFEDVDDLFYDFTADELGIDPKTAAKIDSIKRLRPLSSRQPWGIFFVKFEPRKLPVVALRRILSQVAMKKRASANSAERTAWAADDLLFISNYGEGAERQISFAHFSKAPEGRDLPTLKVLGWDNLDTALHLDAVAKELTQDLAWPKDEEKTDAWRERWRGAFTLRHREVIDTAKDLAIRLAALARAIRDRIKAALAIETDRGPLTKLLKAFQETLVHDLDAEGFADMYAQTIAYGLLSARIADPHSKTADDISTHMRTNPFLKELMQTFLNIGGRRGKAGGPGIDFDELGVSEVVELLDHANMEAVVRDFGDRNRQEDPVMHFYESFLQEYNKQLKIQRGVFYTPQPVVSYIVRSVHELLQTEFGLDDGLADTTTWGEMLNKHPRLKLPPLTDEPGEKRAISPEEPFVQILDPATGTATFLVEVIDVIYRTLAAKWWQLRFTDAQQRDAWNDYVPKHLLPRLHAFELMMAPYAIAHMKISLKLAETGYAFRTEERARIYLTNALEPWQRQLKLPEFDALAHEAAAVNEIKRHKRFTVIIGNPPYSGQSANTGPWISACMREYYLVNGVALGERNPKWLQDDYVKFTRFAQVLVEQSRTGILGYITNHGYLGNPTFRGMRSSLMKTFSDIRVIDLHGNSKKREVGPQGGVDENVFDIQQGVGISLMIKGNASECKSAVAHSDLWGLRSEKYERLDQAIVSSTRFSEVNPALPFYLFVPQNETLRTEYQNYPSIVDAMPVSNVGFVTSRDDFVMAFDRGTLLERFAEFRDRRISNRQIQERYAVGRLAVETARGLFSKRDNWQSSIVECQYRPFDKRFICYADELLERPRRSLMGHLLAGGNIALLSARSNKSAEMNHFYCSRLITETKCSESSTQSCVFPLYVISDDDLIRGPSRHANFSESFVRSLRETLGVPIGNADAKNSLSPEDIFQYAYGLFHSLGYRNRYAEFLKTDFPRLPLTRDLELFRALARFGGELVALHLLESPKLDQSTTEFIGGRGPEVEKASWSKNSVWLDKAQTTGFKGVREDVWNFQIGGYQVCEKWLKDRKGRKLLKTDIDHYQRIIVALSETIRLMTEIDGVIEKHGGWPEAFFAGSAATSKSATTNATSPDNVVQIRGVATPQLEMYESELPPLKKAAEPRVPEYNQPSKTTKGDGTTASIEDLDRDELICQIRQLFTGGDALERESAITDLARELGYQRTGPRIHEVLDDTIRTAVRRGILENTGGNLRIGAKSVEQYEREFLKDQFLASLGGNTWTEREDAIRAFARWLGFRRTGPAIDDVARSLINGLIRDGRLESDGSVVRRAK